MTFVDWILFSLAMEPELGSREIDKIDFERYYCVSSETSKDIKKFLKFNCSFPKSKTTTEFVHSQTQQKGFQIVQEHFQKKTSEQLRLLFAGEGKLVWQVFLVQKFSFHDEISGGSGKSFLIKRIVQHLRSQKKVKNKFRNVCMKLLLFPPKSQLAPMCVNQQKGNVVAFSGRAAHASNASTIHSFLGQKLANI